MPLFLQLVQLLHPLTFYVIELYKIALRGLAGQELLRNSKAYKKRCFSHCVAWLVSIPSAIALQSHSTLSW